MKSKTRDPKFLRALEESEAALRFVQSLMKNESGDALHAWLRHFDKDHNHKVSLDEFRVGMAKLKYKGDCGLLFRQIDVDGSGDVTFDEIDREASKIWVRFRLWCVNHFSTPHEMVRKLTDGSEKLSQEDFISGLRRFGWQDGEEDLIFGCINIDDRAYISASYFRWFALDKRKEDRKREARERALRELSYLSKRKRLVSESLHSFRMFLKKRFVTYLRAWRLALDTDGTMSVQKTALLKAVKDIDWPGDARLLWKGLDKDGSGFTTLQELHLRTASVLARFKHFCTTKYGSVVRAFNAFDDVGKGRMTDSEFLEACRRSGFSCANRALFHGLHSPEHDCLYERDVVFLDNWKCPAYLISEANEEAAKQFKSLLLHVYETCVKAWKLCLDKNRNNFVGWDDFELAAKNINFKGDIPGAWRYFDSEFDGVMTFREFDQESYDIMNEFKMWADEQFGGVKMAFVTADTNQSGEMSTKEFKRAMSAFGYQGDLIRFLDALSTDRHGVLALRDIAFIDDWESAGSQIYDVDIPPTGDTGGEAVLSSRGSGFSGHSREYCMSDRMLKMAQPKERLPPAACASRSRSSSTVIDESMWLLKAPKSPYMPRGPRSRRGGRPGSRSSTRYYHAVRPRVDCGTPNSDQLSLVGASHWNGRLNSVAHESSWPESTDLSLTQMCILSAKQMLLKEYGMTIDTPVRDDQPDDDWNIPSIHEKTISLRLRTLDLLGKTNGTELENESVMKLIWPMAGQGRPRDRSKDKPHQRGQTF